MSRSHKKNKFQAITNAHSEKQNKREANRKFRRVTKLAVQKQKSVLPKLRETSSVWGFDKDGKTYNPDMTKKEMSK